jgi:hypothetical protein
MPTKLSSQIPLPLEKKWSAAPVSFEGDAGIAVYFACDDERHGLRHSYATHLREAGTRMPLTKIIHAQIYTHVGTHAIRHIPSPFDSL